MAAKTSLSNTGASVYCASNLAKIMKCAFQVNLINSEELKPDARFGGVSEIEHLLALRIMSCNSDDDVALLMHDVVDSSKNLVDFSTFVASLKQDVDGGQNG